ncbi:periodic tryptophan protein 2 homolog [Macrosteles quadrilineatus]|uniref:periodic tryptophan protein 2 homolog n=1 Tax=Macrosteles quadrilineatus TaxID=74068 RepID=UPI0023E1C617|nr:periodic tryptophan protein 2 homolog [Macrosteles quadrilineatus]
MKFSYKFSNLLGTVYRKGNLLFTPDGNSVISPVGNRISIHDLKNNKSSTLAVESKYDFAALDISPNGSTLIAINEQGDAHLISLLSRVVVHQYKFNHSVTCIKFSPDGSRFAVCKQNNVFIFKAPGQFAGQFNQFVLERVYHNAYDETTCVDWASDSRVLAVGCKDTSTRLYCLDRLANFRPITLGSQNDVIVAVFFEENSLDVTTIARNGRLCVWESSLELSELEPYDEPEEKKKKAGENEEADDDVDLSKGEERTEALTVEEKEEQEDEASVKKSDAPKLSYKLLTRHYLRDQVAGERVTVTAAAYHRVTHVLVTGFSNGTFLIHELPDVTLIHSLSISEHSISSLALNNIGDWVAVGSRAQGQLLVWEWQSETYVMKQQGHAQAMTCLSYSPNAQYIVTGGEDGKVKLWNTQSGFCFVTFHEHTSSVTAVKFANNGKFLVSTSLDGTVRAFDMTRYRNYRTLTSPRPVQFCSLALDHAGEFVAAGGQDVFDIFLWSMTLGRLLEVLSGHQGPVVGLQFNPSTSSTALASVSWDKSLRLWNAVESNGQYESVLLNFDATCVAYRPDGKQVAVATLDGRISMFDVQTAQQVGSIEGRYDLGSGRSDTDLITAKKTLAGKAFTSMCYSADGLYILAGGQSKNVCIYNVAEAILVKKIEITQNHSFDAIEDIIDRRKMTEWGNAALIEEAEELEGGNVHLRLPGVRKGDMAARGMKPEVRVYHVQFSPTGQAWAAVTTEGLLVYSLDSGVVFDPFHLDPDITPASVLSRLGKQEYGDALMMALRLNEQKYIQRVVESIPPSSIELCVSSLLPVYAERLLTYVAATLETTRHLELYVDWLRQLVTRHPRQPVPTLLLVHKNLGTKYSQLARLCDFNRYTYQFLKKIGPLRTKQARYKDNEDKIEEDLSSDDENEEFLMETD